MKRPFNSLFFQSRQKSAEISRTRWNWLSIGGKILRKTCMALGAVVLFSLVMGFIAATILRGAQSLPEEMILVLNVTDPIGESDVVQSFSDPFAAAPSRVSDLVAALDRAARDKRVKGLLLSLDAGGMELAHIQELRAAVKRFRAAGKFAHAYTASFADLGSGIGAYYLAAAFDEIWMQPVGMVSITGLALEVPFARGVLDKVGAKPEFLHREEYKSAMESFTNTGMSGPSRENLQSIMDDFSRQIFYDITEDRKIKKPDMQKLVDQGLITGKDALKAGLITKLDYGDKLLDHARETVTGKKDGEETPLIAIEDYADVTAAREYDIAEANAAFVHVTGEIVPGADPEPGFATGDYIASGIMEAAESDSIQVIVVRVDSPGGSPTASETIRRAIVYAKEKGKKVVVSMGPVAASGGYWITVDADHIFALPTTLTGSIGVIMGKFELSQLWKKVGVNWESIGWGENSRLWSINAPLKETERAALTTAIDATYDAFLERVAEGRNMEPGKVRELAKGRAWTGLQAVKNGLADDLGGLDTALDHAATLTGGKTRKDLRMVVLPRPLSPMEQLVSLLGGRVAMAQFGYGSEIWNTLRPTVQQVRTLERLGPVQAYDPSLRSVRP